MCSFLLFIRYYTKFLIFRRSIRNYSRPEIGSRPIGRELLLYAEVLRFVYISYVHPLRGLFLKKKKPTWTCRIQKVGFDEIDLSTRWIIHFRHCRNETRSLFSRNHTIFMSRRDVRSLYMRSISIVPWHVLKIRFISASNELRTRRRTAAETCERTATDKPSGGLPLFARTCSSYRFSRLCISFLLFIISLLRRRLEMEI